MPENLTKEEKDKLIALVRKASGKDIVDALDLAVNGGERKLIKGFEEELPDWHPTLQQAWMRVMRACIRTLAKKEYCDDRNRGTVNLCKAIAPVVETFSLPFI